MVSNSSRAIIFLSYAQVSMDSGEVDAAAALLLQVKGGHEHVGGHDHHNPRESFSNRFWTKMLCDCAQVQPTHVFSWVCCGCFCDKFDTSCLHAKRFTSVCCIYLAALV